MTSHLTNQQINKYQREGVLFPINVLTAKEVFSFRKKLAAIATKHHLGKLKRVDNLHLFFSWFYKLITHKNILDIVEGIIGDTLLIDGSLILCKPPFDPGFVAWHQDSFYSDWHLQPSVSVWIALTESNRDNGCMRVIPRSHKQGKLGHETLADKDNLLRRGESVNLSVDLSQATDIELQAGAISLHHCNIIHGSDANHSKQERMGLIVRFINQQARCDRLLLRARGKADCSHLNLSAAPTEMDSDIAYKNWKKYQNTMT